MALSAPTAWERCKPTPQGALEQLWEQHMPPGAAVAWWMQQLAPAEARGGWLPHLHEQRQRVYALCSLDYLELVGKLLGPVAGEWVGG